MSGYISPEKSRLYRSLYEGDISRSGIEISDLLNTLSDMTNSRFDYMQQPATEEKEGDTLAVYPLWCYFLQRGSMLIRARTRINPGSDILGGEEKVSHVSVKHTRLMNKGLALRVERYLIDLEKGD